MITTSSSSCTLGGWKKRSEVEDRSPKNTHTHTHHALASDMKINLCQGKTIKKIKKNTVHIETETENKKEGKHRVNAQNLKNRRRKERRQMREN